MDSSTPDLFTPLPDPQDECPYSETPYEIEAAQLTPFIPMKDVDFDICYYLSIFPEGFECNTCSIISE